MTIGMLTNYNYYKIFKKTSIKNIKLIINTKPNYKG